MSGGAGHIFDMINRLKGNANLLKKPGYFKTREELLKITGKTIYTYKSATPAQLKSIRRKLSKQQRLEFFKTIVFLIGALVISSGLIYLMAYWFFLK